MADLFVGSLFCFLFVLPNVHIICLSNCSFLSISPVEVEKTPSLCSSFSEEVPVLFNPYLPFKQLESACQIP